ncbi:MAG: response regulator transcription factor [Lachnospiraceae bacterium]
MEHSLTVLIIEDEKCFANVLADTLKAEGYKAIPVYNGTDGLSLIASLCPDVILLDLGLPDIDGLEVIREVRTWSSIPIIVISARLEEDSKVAALDLGADDYVAKPYSSSELFARIRAAVRHSYNYLSSAVNPTFFSVGALYIDYNTGKVSLEKEEIRLTPIEFKLVSLLAHNAGKVMTYSSIMKQIWGPFMDADNCILRVNMVNIRRKLEKNPSAPVYLHTELGIGYRMIDEMKE